MNGEGNRCGHDPANPRWFAPPEKHKERPRILVKLSERVRRYYDAPAETIPSLNFANGSDRQQRSERREACISLLGCLVHYLDLPTLRVGIPQSDGSFSGLTMPYLAAISGLGERRAERAIADLVAAGIITVHPIARRIEECVYKGYAAIRTVSAKLFTLFGLGQWLRHERDKASARQRKRWHKEEARKLAQAQVAMSAAGAKHPPQAKPQDHAGATKANKPTVVGALLAGIKARLKGTDPPD